MVLVLKSWVALKVVRWRAAGWAARYRRAVKRLQHKFGKCVPKALRSYLQVPTLMLYHYLEVNPIRLGGKNRMALGAHFPNLCCGAKAGRVARVGRAMAAG